MSRLVTTCVEAPRYFGGDLARAIDALNAFDENRREISIHRFIRLVGARTLAGIRDLQGYAWGRERGLRLAGDYHVRAYRGRFDGRPVVVLMWSAIHMIFSLEPGEIEE